jgi:hypothetical protein
VQNKNLISVVAKINYASVESVASRFTWLTADFENKATFSKKVVKLQDTGISDSRE